MPPPSGYGGHDRQDISAHPAKRDAAEKERMLGGIN